MDKATIANSSGTTTFAVDKGNGTITATTENSASSPQEKRIYLPQSFSFAVAKLDIANSNTPSVESKGDSDSKNTTIPSAGTAFYKGIAVGFKTDKTDFDVGTLFLEVNFQEKKVTAKDDAITRADGTKIKFEEGTITDSTYTGTAKVPASGGGADKQGTYEGKFFGRNAAETAGKVEFNASDDDKFLNTAFIGKKETK